MSRAEKPKAIPADPELEAAEQRRRDELASSGAYQRGVAQAKADALRNIRGILETKLSDLKRATVTRDTNIPGRDKYNRVYNDAVKAAERLALATGQPVSGIPAWLPPPAPTDEDTVTIGVPKVDPNALLLTAQGKVAKPAGMGKSGKGSGVTPGFPGSDQHNAWLNTQGGAK